MVLKMIKLIDGDSGESIELDNLDFRNYFEEFLNAIVETEESYIVNVKRARMR